MKRWTMAQLAEIDDLDFAICIMNERRAKLDMYSPLAQKLAKVENTIREIKTVRDMAMEVFTIS